MSEDLKREVIFNTIQKIIERHEKLYEIKLTKKERKEIRNKLLFILEPTTKVCFVEEYVNSYFKTKKPNYIEKIMSKDNYLFVLLLGIMRLIYFIFTFPYYYKGKNYYTDEKGVLTKISLALRPYWNSNNYFLLLIEKELITTIWNWQLFIFKGIVLLISSILPIFQINIVQKNKWCGVFVYFSYFYK